jgi:predicted permease
MTRLRRRLRRLFRPTAVAQEIAEELQEHIRMEADDLMRQGVPPAEAERQARLAFGGVARFTEEARDAWPLRGLQRLGADVRYALRSLRQTPAFTLTAIVALAVSMGANATVFGAVDSMALRSLSVRDPGSLYAVYGTQGDAELLPFSWPSYLDLARGASAFSGVLAFTERAVTVSEPGRDDAAVVWAAHTSDNYFSELGVVPAIGSFYQPGDLASPVVVLSEALWSARFDRDPRMIGRTLQVNGTAFTVIGVAPAQFTGTRLFTYDPAVWIPVGTHARTIPQSAGLLTDRGSGGFHVVGRAGRDVTVLEARASVDGVARDLSARFPDQYKGLTIDLISNRTPINPWLAPPERIALIGRIALAGCLLVLLIACATVSSLLLARMTVRRQEMAARQALGASRGRLVQQLLTESLVLAALGAVAAIPIHLAAARGLVALTPPLEFASTFRPASSSRVLLWNVLLTSAAALMFGLGPALQGTGRGLGSALREMAGRGGGLRWARLREVLVVGQAMVSALVVVAGGLLVRSLQRAHALDTGFAVDGAVTFTVDPGLSPRYDPSRTQQFYRRLDTDLAALPGVRHSARAVSIPLDGSGSTRRVLAESDAMDFARAPVAEFNLATPGFLAALGTPLLEGREFAPADTGAREEPAVINTVLARRLWPNESALGKRIRLQSPAGPLLVVVGVAHASLYRTLGERPRAALWLSLDRHPRSRTVVLVRADGSTAGLAARVHRSVRAIDPSLPISGLGTLREHLSVAYASVETAAAGALAFGGLGLLLTASGMYGITAYAVSQRRREIGIRMALGARGPSVLRLVAGRALALTLGGALLGGLLVALVPMGLDSLLHGVARGDLAVLLSATGLFSGVAVLAALSAARRAVRLSPMRVLRLD